MQNQKHGILMTNQQLKEPNWNPLLMQNEAFDLLADSRSRKFLKRYRLYFYEPSLMDSGVHPTLHSKCYHQMSTPNLI